MANIFNKKAGVSGFDLNGGLKTCAAASCQHVILFSSQCVPTAAANVSPKSLVVPVALTWSSRCFAKTSAADLLITCTMYNGDPTCAIKTQTYLIFCIWWPIIKDFLYGNFEPFECLLRKPEENNTFRDNFFFAPNRFSTV